MINSSRSNQIYIDVVLGSVDRKNLANKASLFLVVIGAVDLNSDSHYKKLNFVKFFPTFYLCLLN